MKRASEIFAPVDQNLKVRDRGNKRTKDFDAAGGAVCPRCGEEAVRFRPEDGICFRCARLLDEKFFSDKRKHDKFERFRKAHNARIRKR